MEKLFEQLRQDTCRYCGKDKAIELYDKNNNPVRFSFILDSRRTILLDIREILYGECKFCHKRFKLDWSADSKIPIPLSDIKLLNYLKQYNKSKV